MVHEPNLAENQLAGMRMNYGGAPGSSDELDETSLSEGWAPLLRRWLDFAIVAPVVEPNAMVLATVDAEGHPASRMVLCKGLSDAGVVFYTNYGSDKAIQLAAVPYASVTFGWPSIGRQVTLRGRVERVDADITAQYWRTRPRGSQLGAWASEQSRPIGSRADLEQALIAVLTRFDAAEHIPLPPNWGGYILRPSSAEFWQGRENRLHNRIRATVDSSGEWTAMRLQP